MNVNGTLSQTTEATSGVPEGPVIDPILFVIYVNDLPYFRLQTASSIPITQTQHHRNRHKILESSLNVSAWWSKDWALDLNLTKSAHLSIGNWPRSVTCTLPSHCTPSTQRIQKVSTTRNLGLAEDNVISSARRMLFYLKRCFAALTPTFFSPCTKGFAVHALNCYPSNASHPLPEHRGVEKGPVAHSEVREGGSSCSIWSSSPTASINLSCLIDGFKAILYLCSRPAMAPWNSYWSPSLLIRTAQGYATEIVNASSLKSFKVIKDTNWQSLFLEIPIWPTSSHNHFPLQ